MRIVQMVSTIVGEGLYAGKPCFLVRLAGCNLHCKWCDTPTARHGGKEIPTTSIIERGLESNQDIILLTGGEPLSNKSAIRLVKSWVENKFVIIETNGTENIENFLLDRTSISMDIKTPSSGESGKYCQENLSLLRPVDVVKFTIAHREDFLWAKRFVNKNKFISSIFFQPVWGRLSAKRLAQWIIEEIPQVRLSVQLHKILKLP